MIKKTAVTITEKQLIGWGDYLPVNELYPVLGFSRIDNCYRFLNSPKFYYGTILDDWDKPCRISLRLFFDLVKLRVGWNNQWEELFTAVWTAIFEKINDPVYQLKP